MKKSILMIITCFIANACYSQFNTTKINASVTLIIKNSPQQSFKLRCSDEDMRYKVVDSASIGKNGGLDSLHFDLNIIGQESRLSFIFSEKSAGRFNPVLAPGEHLKVIMDIDKPGDISYTGSERTSAFYKYFNKRSEIGKDYAKHKIELNAHSADSVALKHKLDSITDLISKFSRESVFNTNCAYVAQLALLDSQNGVVNYTNYEYDQLRDRFKDATPVLKQIDINEKFQNNPVIPKIQPANGSYLAGFTLPDGNGKQVSLEQFKGKYVLVDIWASWCGPCRAENPFLKDTFQRFGSKNFVIVSISVDKDSMKWQKALKEDGTSKFVQLIDNKDGKSDVLKLYNIDGIPSNFLLDPTGKIIDKDLRGKKLVDRIAGIM